MRSVPPTLSRALLTPGPLPPLSHLGLTLLRHTVATGLRYAFYHLGLPLPEAPPVRAVRLRLYLDGGKLDKLLQGTPGGAEIAAALLDPGGAGALPPGAGKLAAAATLHRVRLRLARPSTARLPRSSESTQAGRPSSTDPEAEPWSLFQSELSRLLRRTNDALLAELLSSLDRRARRARGQELPPTPSRAAAALLAGRTVPIERFGIPDPLASSWTAAPSITETARTLLAKPLRGDRLRGSFRETYRAALTQLAPLLAAHAAAAVARGSIDNEEDAYFLPLDLQEDLGSSRPTRLSWVEAAVRDNRAEREALLPTPEPSDLLYTGLETTPPGGQAAWDLTPLLPLP